MNIVHIAPIYPPATGGMGTVAHAYVEALKERGYDVSVLHPENTRPLLRFGYAAFAPSIFWKARDADLIHLHYPFYGSDVLAVLAAWWWRIPLVITYHMRTKASGWKGFLFWLHRILIEPMVLRAAKKILVSSTDYAQSIGLHGTVDMPFWVDTDRFFAGDSFVRTHFRIRDDEFLFLFVGALDTAHYFKGIPVLLEACARLPQKPAWQLIIAGGGDREDEYRALARELGVDRAVRFASNVAPEDLPAYYRAADTHILPSIDGSEAFGLVTLEAAASALPSIVSDLPGVRTLVEVDKTGLVVVPNDVESLAEAMQKMLEAGEGAQAMGIAAQNRVLEKYSRHICIDRLLAVYKDILA